MSGTTANVDNWQCQRCTLINQLLYAQCAACQTPKPTASTPTQRPPNQTSNRFILPLVSSAVARIDSAIDVLANQFTPLTENLIHGNDNWLCSRCNRLNQNENCSGCNLSKQIEKQFFKWRCERCALQQPESPIDAKCPLCHKKSALRVVHQPKLNMQGYLDQSAYSQLPIQSAEEDSRECARVYETIIRFCNEYNQSFIDDSFPHSNRSIGDLSSLDRPNLNIIWLRPQDIVTKDGRKCRWSIFNDPKSSDIEQGLLGNCWFISALSLIAERREILETIFINNKEYSANGVYMIRLYIDGLPKTVVIDDFFPCHAIKRTMIFAVGRMNQLWVSLIEKALAKCYGSYSRLRAGRIHEGLVTLIGCPCQTLDLDACLPEDQANLDFVWAQLVTANEALFLMGASCGAGRNPVNIDEYKGLGLMAQHAYSILNVCQVGSQRLIRLKNPWGQFVWSGEWSPKWSGWTDQLRRELNPGGHSTGTFWMPFEQFAKYFDAVDIARLNLQHTVRWPLNIGWDAKRCGCIRLVVTEPTEVFISLFQKSRAGTDDLDILVLVHREDETAQDVCVPGELVAKSERRVHASVNVEDLFLLPGTYVVYAISMIKAVDGFVQSGSMVVYSARRVHTEVFPAHSRYMRKCLENLMIKYGRVETVKSDCIQSTNVISTRGTLTTFDSIPPMHRQIVGVLTHFESTQPFSVRHRLDVRLVSRAQLGQMFTPAPQAQHAPGFFSETGFGLHGPTPMYL
ncbi:hypothetical protein M3Y98_00164000 [Aphelenchoides besseyi]|nr:hypothetical protein M3Y98_00164000 [Aphelenchoides besseyi]KAI6199938.1 hypothetical protein M3Y96_00680300 [Aphelenchoides besseyi]